ncbi:SMI1/KNR4 family protein [Virgibacillus sp. LDC1]|uniref:SMI1/KNR4 family protein n=1 Tax=Paenibacillus lautus TaxID=1401 RepID=UPI002DBF978B|nr:SMI1/KNR4 family protein [Paenibacillus lautus]MCV4230707.1 SMI1/KNR4 family protein [Virgibacillus sp. LDC1]MEC0258993.1 SMI1/KNR4 family protein [Paenibacillus lautus]
MEIRNYIKQGFETYYAKYSQVTEEGFCRWMRPDVPAEMKAVDTGEEWSIWKLVPSTISEVHIGAMEQEYGLTFPEWYKAFISTYHHYFDIIPEQAVDEPLDNVRDMYNSLLCRLGYLPFTWDSEYGKIWCIDVNEDAGDGFGAIYEIEHEICFDLDEEQTDRAELQKSLVFLYPDFKAYFDHTFLEG